MKNLRLTLGMLAIAVGAVSAFAFAPAPVSKTAEAADPMLHWFDANTGNYLGERTKAQQQTNCGPAGNISCADGYQSIDQDGEPVGTPDPVKSQ